MCGIVGLIDYNNSIDYDSILSMVNSLKHRGPDNSDFFLSENKHIFLGHTRLSILDLKLTGSQPFVSQSKNLVLTYNGEIYNFNNIKKELNSSFGKINWKSGTDTEVLINSIEYLGLLKTLSILRGMFAFALFDIKKNCISLVRDNVGEKPLYYGFNKGKFYFGSDLIAFESNKNFSKDIDKKSLGNYFKYNYIPSPKSIYSDIYKLKPGNILTLDLNKVHLGEESFNINEYWSIDNFNQKKIIKKDYNINKINIKKKLTRSVEEQLTSSDIETSVMLSSGIDSSLVASIASKIKKNLTTYSLGFKNKKFDESKQAYKIAAHLNTKHYNFEMGAKDALKMCETLSKSYSEPFSDSSQLATLFLASKISKNHKVILTGDGGDELFGGYSRYVKYNTISKLNSLLKFDKTNFLNKIINNLAKQKILSSFTTLNNLLRISETSKITSNNSEFFDVLISHKTINLFKEKISNNKKKYENINSAIDLMKKDFKLYLPDDLLVKMDRACMFYGVENRSPFLCKDLISYVISDVPIDHKIKNNNGKYILKDILADYLPTSLINKKKQGFVIPLKEWLINDMNAWASELLKPDHLNNFNEYNINKIIHLWKNIKNISYDEVYALWDVLVFQNWYYRRNV